MNELLGMMTVFNVMLGGSQKVTGPVPCDKQVTARVGQLLLADEGKIGENVTLERTENTPETFFYDFRIREEDGSERHRIYHVATSKDCSKVEVKPL